MTLADPRAEIRVALDDYQWARERVNSMCASALLDAQVYGKKLLKGFGYPDETFGRAQDYRALLIVLAALDQQAQEIQRLQAEQKRLALIDRAESAEADVQALREKLAVVEQRLDYLVGACAVNPVSSRICERGTAACNVKHASMKRLAVVEQRALPEPGRGCVPSGSG